MGGLGSGRQFGKRTTNQVSSVNVKDLGAADRLHGSVRFRYSLVGKPVEHTVQLTQTACNYGGVRHWFGASIAVGAWAFFIYPAVNMHVGIVSSWRISRSVKAAHTDFTGKPTRCGFV